MITFIFIFGVALRVVPMLGVLWLIWHVSRTPTATGLRSEREAPFWWPPANMPAAEESKRSVRAGRPFPVDGGKSGRARRVREFAPLPAPPTAE